MLDYLFVENCRICRKFVVGENSPALTLCADCFAPLDEQEVQIDECIIEDGSVLRVAHAVSYEETMKMLIYKLKYDSDRLIARDLSLLLSKALDLLKELLPASAPVTLVPVPLSRWKQIQRGFNQAELLAKHLRKKNDVQLNTKILVRRKHTRPQHDLNRMERQANLYGAFKYGKAAAEPIDRCNIVLVDDIHTSGSTLAEAARVLQAAGAKEIAAITVARVQLHLA